tara:strand:+ start:767 stop:1378 length:612 start_codon:yes stop_codon:yes gene_type:complete
MRSLSEIDTLSKRASKGIGFSWGISEEIGKSIRLMEMFGLPGLKNLNNYFKNIKTNQFQNISLITEKNISNKIPYCPLIAGINFMDQINSLEKFKKIIFYNMAYPILFIPFVSRSSEIIGKKLSLKIENQTYLLNFNQSIYLKNIIENLKDKAELLEIEFIENKNSFDDKDWQELYKLSEETFVKESESSKNTGAGAGLLDND